MTSLSHAEEKNQTILVRLKSITYEAKDVNLYEFIARNGEKLQAFSAGSHIDIYLPNGLIRQYSLCNSPLEKDRYVIE
jgi:vanillate O-demethylase ferredoxin subunit